MAHMSYISSPRINQQPKMLSISNFEYNSNRNINDSNETNLTFEIFCFDSSSLCFFPITRLCSSTCMYISAGILVRKNSKGARKPLRKQRFRAKVVRPGPKVKEIEISVHANLFGRKTSWKNTQFCGNVGL